MAGPDLVPVAVTPLAPDPAAADAAVEIATIEAERDVSIAEIAADTQIAAIDAATDQEAEDIAWLRGELDGLRARCETLEAGLSGLGDQNRELSAALAMLTETVATQAALLASQPAPDLILEPPSNPKPAPVPAAILEPAANAGDRPAPAERIRTRRWLR